MKTIFLSYNGNDLAWAEWVGQEIEKKNAQVILQHWDFAAGANFVAKMHEALQTCDKLAIILSRNYLSARFTNEEWQAAFALRHRIIPFRIDNCEPPGLLAPIAYVDLFGQTEEEARRRIADALDPKDRRSRPVPFPGRRR
ncbi:toll/interleukin-1 receptor domain-containing protein [Azohydromonas caseinilytica]|uniref:Toll/interleukin-1 receptor domain-containing protein n=1 Tax=Azohydromonas caseinilytica TaxID=2728836 RepID=A0A848FBN2_9BURK|nr:toll/interleukin-1 receptor domain-containing protein [Azohydromonas caseinilytica]NML16924.1 toll/interleukin-1 receptor domain-containing protein [Azohydromonas caseinilytica]